MGRSESIWGKDALEFKPSRWINRKTLPTPFEFPAFHSGPRACLGRSMAEIEGVFVLVSFFCKYDYKVINMDEIQVMNSLTCPIDGELKIRVSKRV